MIAGKSASHSRCAVAGPIGDRATGWRAVPTVFYDGACPLCRREIEHYRRLRAADRLAWVDISHDQDTLDAHGLSRQAAMARLHVLDAAGNWQTGAWAFAELWSHLPGYHFLASLLRRARVLPLLDRVYTVFARWRVRKRCDATGCTARPGGSAAHRAEEAGRLRNITRSSGERSCA